MFFNPAVFTTQIWSLEPFFCYPMALRTHILRLLGLKTILYKAFGPF